MLPIHPHTGLKSYRLAIGASHATNPSTILRCLSSKCTIGASCYTSTHPTWVYIVERCDWRNILPIHPLYWGLHRGKIQWMRPATHPPTILRSIWYRYAMETICYPSTHHTEVYIVKKCNGRIMLPNHSPYWGLYRRQMQWEVHATIHQPYWGLCCRKNRWEHHATHPPTTLRSISYRDVMRGPCPRSTHHTEVYIVERCNGSIMLSIHSILRCIS